MLESKNDALDEFAVSRGRGDGRKELEAAALRNRKWLRLLQTEVQADVDLDTLAGNGRFLHRLDLHLELRDRGGLRNELMAEWRFAGKADRQRQVPKQERTLSVVLSPAEDHLQSIRLRYTHVGERLDSGCRERLVTCERRSSRRASPRWLDSHRPFSPMPSSWRRTSDELSQQRPLSERSLRSFCGQPGQNKGRLNALQLEHRADRAVFPLHGNIDHA